MALSLASRDRDRRAPLGLLAEAGCAIVVATLAIRLRTFNRIARDLERASQGAPADTDSAYWIRRSVGAWGHRLPWRAKCFEQGLAAAAMLRRRGFAYEVHYGAVSHADALKAHVWVTSGGSPVVGYENAAEHAELAVFKG